MSERVRLERGLFDRWIIMPAHEKVRGPVCSKWLENRNVAWSGSRWVPIGGPVQVCNFDTAAQAAGYATSLGFEVVE